MIEIVYFIILGVLGGFTAVLTVAEKWADLQTFASIKRYIIGAIVGGLYWLLYSQYSFPNFIMAFVSGYSGTDFINKLVERMQKKEEPK